MQEKISIVIPVKDEEENILPLYRQIVDVCKTNEIDFELIFIDDGSTDSSVKVIKSILDNRIRLIEFQTNFGKGLALTEGFKIVNNDLIFMMDSDLQDDPKEIPKFLEAIKDCDVVNGWKKNRKDPLHKVIMSRCANWLQNKVMGTNFKDMNCGFKLFRKKVIKNVDIYGGFFRYILAIAKQKGFKIKEIEVEHHKRNAGKTKFGWKRIPQGLLDLLSVYFLFRNKSPLRLFGSIGIFFLFIGGLAGLYLTRLWVIEQEIGNRPLVTLTALMLIVGLFLFCFGLLAELILYQHQPRAVIKNEE